MKASDLGIKRKNVVTQYIISADDFGKSSIANRNILHLARLGKIHRVSIMMLGTWNKQQIEELLSLPISLDIHLELPRESGDKHYSRQKVIIRSIEFLFQFLFKKRRAAEFVRDAWTEQIESFRQMFGKLPDGFNTHEHVHFFPGYFRIFSDLGKKYAVQFIRFGSKGVLPKNTIVSMILQILNRMNRKKFQRSGLVSSEWMVSLDWNKKLDHICMPSQKEKMKSVEIVCHPERKNEFEFLKSGSIRTR